jgi:uncharacterized protein YcfL
MKRWFFGLGLVVWLVGCSSSPPVGLITEGKFQRVLISDPHVAAIVRVENISSTSINGYARGIVRIKNTASDDFDIQYRFHWYDALGLEVNLRPSAWQHVKLHGGDEASLSEVSLSPKGTEFRVQIREYSN